VEGFDHMGYDEHDHIQVAAHLSIYRAIREGRLA
jgi:hypothetical protein